ncbi:MAG: hypothetical protein BroJett040_21170 [Oligoflexia bacterium]|nr:MAG: hypothetical protein BroJett040_21170 [Oligoflexia bacterium]
MKTSLFTILILSFVMVLSACDKKKSASSTDSASTAPSTPSSPPVDQKFLYVASGSCYGGGVTTSTGIGTIVRYNIDTGSMDSIVMDYNTASPGDMPVAIQNFDDNRVLVLVENAGGRRIDIVNKDGSGYTSYITNSTALSAVGRDMALLGDGSILVSKSSAIEKFNSAKSRVTSGASPFVNAPGSTCATTNTLVSSLTTIGDGKILYTHAAATPNNKTVLISASGYASTADCLTTVAAPATTALPTSALLHSSGHLLIAYGSTTSTSNLIYSYDVDANLNTISNATAAYNNFAVVMGPSRMVEDTATGSVYVANAISSYNNIEKFSYNSSTKTLSRATSIPFISQSAFTRCVSAMTVAN